MNKLVTTLTLAFTASIWSFGQELELHENGVVISGSIITIDSVATADHTFGDYYIVNKTASPVTVTWSRTRRAHMAPYTDQICDDILCFDAADVTNYYRPSNFTIPANDSSVFQPKVYPYGTPGCAIYTYKVYGSLGNFQDSIQVKYRFGGQDCFLALPETPLNYSVYPNPASNLFNINANTNGNAVQVKIFNIMGELVAKETITDGLNTINVSSLTNGVYFYSIIKNSDVIETKKLIVKH